MDICDDSNSFEFTYQTYRAMLEQLQAEGYRFRQYGGELDEHDLLLRHDTDWSPQKALRMGRIEAEYGINATYFFLLTCPVYNIFTRKNREILQELGDLGHEIGLHFSTHQYWDKNDSPPATAIKSQVAKDRDIFESCVPTDAISPAVSFHMPPDWVLNRQFNSFVSVYEKRLLDDIGYVADSSQRWRKEKPFADGFPEKVQLLAHPGSWGETDASFGSRIQNDLEAHFKMYREQFQREYRVEFTDR